MRLDNGRKLKETVSVKYYLNQLEDSNQALFQVSEKTVDLEGEECFKLGENLEMNVSDCTAKGAEYLLDNIKPSITIAQLKKHLH